MPIELVVDQQIMIRSIQLETLMEALSHHYLILIILDFIECISSQPFSIANPKSSQVISATGISLFTISLIAIYKEDNKDNPDEDESKLIL